MKKIVLPIFVGLIITISLACRFTSPINIPGIKTTSTPNNYGPGPTPITASSTLTLEQVALQGSDLKPGFVKGGTQTQTDEPGVIRFFSISYSIHNPLEIVVNSNFIFETADQASAYFQKEHEAAKEVEGSQAVDLPQSLGDEYYAYRGSGNIPSVGIGWRYRNAFIDVSHIGGSSLSPVEISGIVTPIQTRLAGSLASLSQTPAAQVPVANDHDTGQIVFVSCKNYNSLGMNGQCGIYIMDADGSSMRQLTNLDDDNTPSLSPDGRQVAFGSHQQDENDDIYVINTDGSHRTRLTSNPEEETAPAWSPDGRQILFVSGKDNVSYVNIMDADGTHVHVIKTSRTENIKSAAWSPDGRQVVFASGTNDLSYSYLNIMDADGTHVQVIKTIQVENIESAVWSPDGTKIAFINQKTITGPAEVNVIDKDGKNQRSLTAGFYVIFGGLSWSPDGQKILFSMRGDGKSLQGEPQLYIVKADGSNLHKLNAPCAYCYAADWGH